MDGEGVAQEQPGYIAMLASEALTAAHPVPSAYELARELAAMRGHFRRTTAKSLIFQWVPEGWEQRLLACYRSSTDKARVEWGVPLRPLIAQDIITETSARAFCERVAALADAPENVAGLKPPRVWAELRW